MVEQKVLTDYLNNVETDLKLRAIVLLTLFTGLRLGEVLGLREVDVDLRHLVVKVRASVRRVKEGLLIQKPKMKSSIRSVPIPSDIVPFLKEYIVLMHEQKKEAANIYADCGLFFKSEIGNILDPRNVRRAYERLLKRADIEPRKFHALRHTYAIR